MEASSQVIMHSPGGHTSQTSRDHLQSFFVLFSVSIAQQIQQSGRAGKFGCSSESAPLAVEGPAEMPICRLEQSIIESLRRSFAGSKRAELLCNVGARGFDFGAIVAPETRKVFN